MENIIKEKEYQIKVGATAQYMQIENNRETSKLIASLEGKKIFIHNIDENNDELVSISQYEKTGRFKIPIILLEEYIEEELEEKIIEEKYFDYKEYLKQNKTFIIACFLMFLLILFFSIDGKLLKSNISEIKQEKTLFQTLSDRNILLDKKEDLEFQMQKQLRQKLLDSKNRVEQIRNQKSEIAKQKIELAQ